MPCAEKNAAAQVGERNADARRRPPGLAGDRHVAADRLDDEIERGIVLVFALGAEAGDRALDDARVDRRERGVVDLQPLQHAGRKLSITTSATLTRS